ncbi:MAG: hypothetical protein KJ645_05015, partial [Planctomycetes bacterium]|nr:hypothetical protein [Planctomycetota bacterium]
LFLLGSLLISVLATLSCSSLELNFRRFEVGEVAPEKVLETAAAVVKDFYTQVHGGVTLFIAEDQMSFETGYIQKVSAIDLAPQSARVSTALDQPSRQKLYFRIIPGSMPTQVEILATYEIMYIEDPEELENPEDLWKLVKQDAVMEDLIHQKLVERLIETGQLK